MVGTWGSITNNYILGAVRKRIPGDRLVPISLVSGGSYIGIFVYMVININGTILDPDEAVSMQKYEMIKARACGADEVQAPARIRFS